MSVKLAACVVAVGITAGCTSEPQRGLPSSPPAAEKAAVRRVPATTTSPATPPDGHTRMVAALASIRDHADEENRFQGGAQLRQAREWLAAVPQDAPAGRRTSSQLLVALNELRLGNEAVASTILTEALATLVSTHEPWAVDQRQYTLYLLAVSSLRMAETMNCCVQDMPDSCIVPIRGGGIHSNPEGSEGAIVHLEKLLAEIDERHNLYLGARWLLNIAYMTLDRYPDDVPEPYRLPVALFESDETFPPFVNISAGLGTNTFSIGGGAVADDFDGDGDMDIIVSTRDVTERLRYFVNSGDGSFEESGVRAGLEGILGGINLVHADYDNDGLPDVYVLRGGWLSTPSRHPNSLLKNLGDGRFRDVTFEAGLGEDPRPSQAAAWADYDNDGDLDLYVCDELPVSEGGATGQLFQNQGDGTFTDVTAAAGVLNTAHSKGAVWGDIDGDDDPDLFVSNFQQPNLLFKNRGDGTFVNIAAEAGVEEPRGSIVSWFWDFDNDGSLDLFVPDFGADMPDIAADALGLEPEAGPPRLFKGDGRGGFESVGSGLGLTGPLAPLGANFSDADGDGYLDMYIGTGGADFDQLMPNRFFRNEGGKRLVDTTISARLGHIQKGHAVAFADFDNDGDNDIFQQIGGSYIADKYADALYVNPGHGNRWLSVKLVGTTTNRSAIGARITAEVEEDGHRRTIVRWVTSGGSYGGNPLTQLIGIGNSERVERLTVHWPGGEADQVFTNVAANAHIQLTEGEANFVTKHVPHFAFPSGPPGL
ncbi:MAG: CRTAC1 family protein [Nannocystaceae bacterium]|nr:CRTAC1 family protein [Nannocystaceae bacterium]